MDAPPLPTEAAPMTRRTLLTRAAGAGVAAGGLPALLAASASAASAKPVRGGRITSGHVGGGVAEVLDPAKQLSPIDSARALNLFDGLTWPNPDGTIQYRLAESMTPNKDASVWQIKLRKGVTFHNGKALTAYDVLYTFTRNIKKNLVGGAILGQVDLPRCKKVGANELTVALVRGIAEFPRYVSTHLLMITQAGEEIFKPPIGTGPFTFVSWTAGQRSLFKRNPHYWQSSRPYVDELEMLSIPDNTARQNALLSGQIDCLEFLDYSQAKALRSSAAVQLIQAKYGTYIPIYMRVDTPPFSDNNVRTAFKLAINRPQEVSTAALGFSVISNDLFGQGTPSYDSALPQRVYDPEKAKSLLKKAGYDRFKFNLPSSNALPGMLESATAFKEQAKAAGIDVTLEKLDAGSYFSNNKYLKVASYQTNWGQSFESQTQDGMLRTSPYNETHWYSAQWAVAFRKAQQITDTAKRNAAYKALQVPIWKTSGYVVFAFYNTVDAASSKVRGIVPNISSGFSNLGAFDFKDHWFAS